MNHIHCILLLTLIRSPIKDFKKPNAFLLNTFRILIIATKELMLSRSYFSYIFITRLIIIIIIIKFVDFSDIIIRKFLFTPRYCFYYNGTNNTIQLIHIHICILINKSSATVIRNHFRKINTIFRAILWNYNFIDSFNNLIFFCVLKIYSCHICS